MKVVHLTFSGKFGGRERVAFSLVELLKERVHATLYLVIEERTAQEDIDFLLKILKEYDAPTRIFYTADVFSRQTLNELSQAVRDDHADIIHAHCNKSILYALILQKLFRQKIRNTYTLHGLLLPPTLRNMVYQFVNHLSLYLADGVIACSREIEESLSRRAFLGHLETIQNSLLTPRFSHPRPGTASAKNALACKYGIKADAIMIGKVCRIEPQKNVPLYLSIIRRIKDLYNGHSPAVFFIAGDGALRGEMEERARHLDILDCVIFSGFVPDMDEFYAAMDIIALTSDWEGTPMCLLEAMKHGLPIVASKVGGIPHMITDGNEGLLFEKGDEITSTRHLANLIADPVLRQELGANARRRMETDLSPEVWAARHISHYESLGHKRHKEDDSAHSAVR